jgi:hypothetical protein
MFIHEHVTELNGADSEIISSIGIRNLAFWYIDILPADRNNLKVIHVLIMLIINTHHPTHFKLLNISQSL